MLEKIGLPAKPSLRGNNWVVDASNCQGCSSQFTFINRKHHCRRCGGIFCSSCTKQRMVLLGQGDSPVRICEPCKKLEEAARFERRHGHKRRAGRGASKMSLNSDQVLNKILGNDGKDFFSPERDSATQTVSGIQDVATQVRGDQLHKASSANEPGEMVSDSPEKLLQQASDEKRKYKILKGEGKPEEALSAFKRGKELERQAAALERSLRKSRRKDPSSSSKTETHKIKDDFRGNDHRTSCNQIGKEKDGFAAELRELGWSDRDLRDGDEQPAATSWEGELSSLIAETSNVGKRLEVTNKTEVIALKKRALSLKREGKLGEAKEELKKAKILEKQLEEQEFLAGDEDSDDELSNLIRSMEGDKQDFLIQSGQSSFGFDDLESIADDLGVDGNFEVTDEDMDDPEMAAALKSLGWTEDSNKPEGDGSQVAHEDDREEIFSKIRTLKREALSNKRSGHTVEAMALLRKAKVLEKDLDALNSLPLKAENPPNLNDMVDNEKAHQLGGDEPRMAPKNKIKIQRELLGVKKKVLALKREGKTGEAEEELSKGKVLEQQLEELESASKMAARPENITNWDSDILKKVDLKDGGEEDCVTDQDLHDPTYLSFLKNLGWRDEESDITNVKSEVSTPVSSAAPTTSVSRSKGEIQRELLGLKRKALGLRRQGQAEAAEEVLRRAKALEAQMAEMDAPKRSVVDQNEHMESESMKPSAPTVIPSNTASKPMSSRDRFKLQQTSLSHKRQALKLRREGRTEEAEAEFKLAKDLESQLEEPPPAAAGGFGAERVGELLDPQLLSALQNVGMGNADVESQSRAIPEVNVEKSESSAPEIVRLEKQIKDEKIEAVKLKRSGKKAEALDALRRAKVLEKKLDSTVAR